MSLKVRAQVDGFGIVSLKDRSYKNSKSFVVTLDVKMKSPEAMTAVVTEIQAHDKFVRFETLDTSKFTSTTVRFIVDTGSVRNQEQRTGEIVTAMLKAIETHGKLLVGTQDLQQAHMSQRNLIDRDKHSRIGVPSWRR